MTEQLQETENILDARRQILLKANTALQAKLNWIAEWQNTESSRGILGRWKLGEEIDEVWHDLKQNDGKIFGRNSKYAISLFLKEDPSLVNVAHKLYITFPVYNNLVEITQMKMQDGKTSITYSHIRQLLSVKDPQQRQLLLNDCLESCWTSGELGNEVQKLNGGKHTNNPHGRAASPKDANTVIGQMINFADDFDSRNIRVWKDPKHSVSAQIAKLEPIYYTEDLAKKLGEVAHRFRQLALEANSRADEAERKYEEVNKVLKMGAAAIAPIKIVPEVQEDIHVKKRGGRPAGRRVKVG